MSRKARFLIVTFICMIIVSCKADNQSAITMIRVLNLTGYDITEAKVELFFGSNNVELDFQNITDGEQSRFQIIPTDSLNEDGSYCTFTSAEVPNLPFKLSLARLCTGLNDDRTTIIKRGKYILILELEPTELLDLSLFTHASNMNDDSVSIKIRNKSDQNFKEVKVIFPSDDSSGPREVNYGAVASGDSSGFVNINFAYRYAGVVVVTPADTLKFMPTDYVGEEELEPGRYSYDLDIFVGEGDVSRIVEE